MTLPEVVPAFSAVVDRVATPFRSHRKIACLYKTSSCQEIL